MGKDGVHDLGRSVDLDANSDVWSLDKYFVAYIGVEANGLC